MQEEVAVALLAVGYCRWQKCRWIQNRPGRLRKDKAPFNIPEELETTQIVHSFQIGKGGESVSEDASDMLAVFHFSLAAAFGHFSQI